MPLIKKTHELLAELFSAVPTLKMLLKKPFSVDDGMINAWARPKPSDFNPVSTGKGNPLDRVDKLIEMAHEYHPEKAREIAERFVVVVDELDRQSGILEAIENANPCASIANVVEAQARFVKATINGCGSLENMHEVLAKTQALKSAVIQLEGCVKGILQQSED